MKKDYINKRVEEVALFEVGEECAHYICTLRKFGVVGVLDNKLFTKLSLYLHSQKVNIFVNRNRGLIWSDQIEPGINKLLHNNLQRSTK